MTALVLLKKFAAIILYSSVRSTSRCVNTSQKNQEARPTRTLRCVNTSQKNEEHRRGAWILRHKKEKQHAERGRSHGMRAMARRVNSVKMQREGDGTPIEINIVEKWDSVGSRFNRIFSFFLTSQSVLPSLLEMLLDTLNQSKAKSTFHLKNGQVQSTL